MTEESAAYGGGLDGCLSWNTYHVDGAKQDDRELARRLQAGDETAAPLLLSNHEAFLNGCAMDIADRFGVYDLADDLKQEGALALLQAARQFDLEQPVKLLTYAWRIVQAAMLDYAAETTLPVRLPSKRYHQLRKVSWVLANAPPEANEPELLDTLTAQLGVSRRVAQDLLREARSLFDSVQLGERVNDLRYGGDPAVWYAAKLRRAHIPALLNMLTLRERMLIQKYCGFGTPGETGMTFAEIAAMLNYNSPSAAEKAFRRAVAKLAELYGRVGEYGAWRAAERECRAAKREAGEQAEYSTPQIVWY